MTKCFQWQIKLFFFLKPIAAGSITAFIFFCFSSCSDKAKAEGIGNNSRPNIVFIMADDLGYNDLGCYGQQQILTPNIDRMASEGIRFTDFFAGSTVCAPSRSVLMTGQHAGHTRIRANYAREGGLRKPPGSSREASHRRVGLKESDTTIGGVLKNAGYRTAIFGKWHLSGYSMENLPIHRGFDEFRGESLADGESYLDSMEFHQDKVVPVDEGLRALFPDDVKTYHAVDFIRRNKENPFFVVLSLSAPHKPFEIKNQGIYVNKPWNEMSKNYAAMVDHIDKNVGKVLQTLQKEGLDENTIVFFCSDNGGEYREHPEKWANWTRLFRSNSPLRGGKADMYEGGIRVPMIIRWPGKIQPGQTNNQPWYFPDIMPTLADLAGGKAVANTDGISMVPALKGQRVDFPEDRNLYWEFDHRGFMQAMRWKQWKLIRWTGTRKRIYGQAEMNNERRSEKYPFLELYNLEQDIGETTNVVDQNLDVVRKMLDYMDNARQNSLNWPLTEEEKTHMRTTRNNINK